MRMAEANWIVKSVRANDDHTLDLVFADGRTGRFNMNPYLESRAFAPLKSVGFFKLAHVECGTVVWNDNVDIAPERLYEECVELGPIQDS